jgi:anti-anti-sigma regulatory factor
MTTTPATLTSPVLARLGDDRLDDLVAVLRRPVLHRGPVAVVDVSDVSRVTSTILTALLATKRRCRAVGVRLEVTGAAPTVRPVLHRAGLLEEGRS